jgi:hypothetical protein
VSEKKRQSGARERTVNDELVLMTGLKLGPTDQR